MRKLLFMLLFSSACHAQLPLLQVENTCFVNAQTKEKIILKGMGVSNNVWGFWRSPLSDSLQSKGLDPLIRPLEMQDFVFTSQDVANLSQLKGNVVRYCINDELFRIDNPKRNSNITILRSHISQLADAGIYTIVTMQIYPGLDSQNDNFERDKPPYVRLQSVFESDSVFVLWRDVWRFVASKLADMDAVVGYELINEPRRPALVDASEQDLINDYVEIIDSIRAVDSRHIVFVCEFNSREANPGETYWSNALSASVIDKGEQGMIWGRNWLQLPLSTSNLAYVAHIYSPYEFTTGETAATFDEQALQDEVHNTVNWVYKTNNKPLFVSEYGVTYYHTINGDDASRIKWLNTIHNAFEANYVSTTIFQYKDLITPWVDMSGTFGLWQHYYDQSTIASVVNREITYTSPDAQQAAIKSEVDKVLNQYFIKDGKFTDFSIVGNQSLMDELNRYFGATTLGIQANKMLSSHSIYLSNDYQLNISGLSISGNLSISVFSVVGDSLLDAVVPILNGKAVANLASIRKKTPQVFMIRYGQQEKWSSKVLTP